MEDFTEKKAAQTIGEMLKNARIEQNKSIEDIANELCIRKFYLNAIENMDFDNLPSMPYGLGFVRSYAKFLGLNSDRIVAAYRQVISGVDDVRPQPEEHRPETSAPRIKHFVFGALGLLLLAAAWSVFPTSSKFEDVSENSAPVVPEPVIVADEEEKSATVSVDKTLPDNEVVKTENKVAAQDTDTKKQETKTEAKEDKQTPDVEEEVKEEQKAEAEPKKAVLQQMRMELTGPSWLELKKGRKVLLSGVFNKGYKYDIPSEDGLLVSVGRPRNVQFYLNDKPVQVATNLKRRNISLDSYFKKQN